MAAKKTSTTLKKTTSKSTVAASRKGRATKTHAKASADPQQKAGGEEVTIDRRRTARREEAKEPAAPTLERRTKVQRRRQIDPTTCERDYSEQEVEFMNALDHYKRVSGRMFPTCSEVLEVIRGLGYVKLTPAELAVVRPEIAAPTPENENNETVPEPNAAAL